MAQKTRESDSSKDQKVDIQPEISTFQSEQVMDNPKSNKSALEDLANKSNTKKTVSQEEYNQLLVEITEKNLEIKNLTQDIELIKDKSLRLGAELQNIQKQHELDILHAKKSSKKNSLSSLITFINTLHLAFNFIPQDINEAGIKFIDTLKVSFEKLVTELSSIGVEIITPAIGDMFNPENMQALNNATDSSNPKIKQVISLGVIIDGTLINPVMVTLE